MKEKLYRPVVNMRLIYTYILILSGFQVYAQSESTQILNDVRSFEVNACKPAKNSIVSVWMEKRPARKDNSEEATDMRVAYKASKNNGKSWSEKGIVDLPNTFAAGNPFVANNSKGDTYLVCMHIGNDFFSGNISLYEFDFKKEQFSLKSIPIKSDEHLLDKPNIVCVGNEIHLVYIAYTKSFKNNVRYQMSKDKGKTWTEPVNVFDMDNVRYLGPAISLVNKDQIVISTGSQGRQNIYITKRKQENDKIEFETPKIVSKVSDRLNSAMTELSSDGEKLLITWQVHHQRNETWLSFSTDKGDTWSEPRLITATGNLLSATFDKSGNIHCIYSDFSDQKFFVGYKSFNTINEILKEGYLKKPETFNTFNEYLGAYQKLLVQDNELFAFWIDYPNNSTLKFTKWKM